MVASSDPSLSDLLQQCADARAAGENRRVVELAEQAGRTARQSDDRLGAAVADAQRAYGYMRLEEDDLARDLAVAVLPTIDELGDPLWRIDTRLTISLAMCALSAAADGLPFANGALKIARDNVATLGRVPISWSLNRLSVVMEELGDTPRAIEIMEQATNVLPDQGDWNDAEVEARWAALMNLGILYRNEAERLQHEDSRRSGDLAGHSLANLEKALDLCSNRGDLTAKCLRHYAGTNLVAGRPLAALAATARLRHLVQVHEVGHDEALTTMFEVRALLALGLVDEARHAETSAAGHESAGQSLHDGYIMESRIMLLMAMGDFEQACRLSEQLRRRERRIMRDRVELQLRSLLRDAEIQHARLEADRAREKAATLERQAATAMQEALVDPLTGLANRRAAQRYFEVWTQAEVRPDLCVAIVDIDHFKRFNDNYGHDVGDAVLCEVSRLLAQSTRVGDLVARSGGEEFIIAMQDCSLQRATEACQRLRSAIKQHQWSLHGVAGDSVTVSVGLTSARADDAVPELLRRADVAMYDAKQAGRQASGAKPSRGRCSGRDRVGSVVSRPAADTRSRAACFSSPHDARAGDVSAAPKLDVSRPVADSSSPSRVLFKPPRRPQPATFAKRQTRLGPAPRDRQ